MSYALQSQVQLSHDLARQPYALNGTKEPNSPEAIRAVAEEFESLFMNMMLKSMRSANRVISEGNYLNSFESKMYEDMLDEKLSVSLSKHGSLGIADLLVRQLSTKRVDRPYDLKMGQSEAPIFSAERREAFPSQAQFLIDVRAAATDAAAQLGIDPDFIVAQAALETGWGQHVMHDGQGNNSHNLFGIKAKDASEAALMIESLEVKEGVATPVKSAFKVYPGYKAAMQDYVRLLKGPRYEGVQNAESIQAFAESLKNGGYATDPDYALKLARVHESINQLQLAVSH